MNEVLFFIFICVYLPVFVLTACRVASCATTLHKRSQSRRLMLKFSANPFVPVPSHHERRAAGSPALRHRVPGLSDMPLLFTEPSPTAKPPTGARHHRHLPHRHPPLHPRCRCAHARTGMFHNHTLDEAAKASALVFRWQINEIICLIFQ